MGDILASPETRFANRLFPRILQILVSRDVGKKLHSKQGTEMGRVSAKALLLIHFESGMAF